MLLKYIESNLLELKKLLNQLSTEEFTQQHKELSNATIGEHIRHIIELFTVLIDQYKTNCINYDQRVRNCEIQTHIPTALITIDYILQNINLPNKDLILEHGLDENKFCISTNYHRELLYNLEHSIHHQALIKVATQKYNHIQISNEFGVARSTLEYRKQCVQ